MKTDLKKISGPSKTRKSRGSEAPNIAKQKFGKSLPLFTFIAGLNRLATFLL